ncbi:uncharacterized protein TNCV_792951 [Trichonephila clavipes]|nr:uncharacterized protein TNCV_792951 [Trichonephila clavipes]
MTTCIPGIALQQFQVKKKQDLLHMEFYHHLPSWDMNEQMSYFSSFSDEWSRDLKSVQVLKQLSCRDESPDPSMSKIVLRNLIISSKYYKEEEAKELLEVITAERKAKRNSDETFSQFASRLTSMWLYYCKLRGANDFESVNQLIVADKMFEMLDSETATHIGVLQGEEWRAIENKLSKLVKTSVSVDGKLVHALVDSGTEITVIKKDLVPGISVVGASTIYLKGIFGPAVKCPLVYVPIGLATGGQVNVVHQQVLCAFGRSFGRRRVASTRGFGYVGRSPE